MSAPRIEIVGAGVAGITVAAELAARGHRPRLIDRAGAPGPHHCSWWAGGMLAPGCEGESAPDTVVSAGRGAADWWEARGAAVTRAGSLVIAPWRDRSDLRAFARRTEGHRTLDAEGIAALEPDLAGRFAEGLFFGDEAHLDPRAALAALLGRLSAAGIGIETAEAGPEPAPGVLRIDCRGLAARDALPGLRGVRGEMAVLDSRDLRLSRPVRLLHPRHPVYLVPRGDGRYMLGATQVESAGRGPVTLRAVMELLGTAYALHPALAEAELVETGADARPAFADNIPAVTRAGAVIRVNGLFRHGYLMAPTLAWQAADLVETLVGKETSPCASY